MNCECANRLSCVNRPGFVCVYFLQRGSLVLFNRGGLAIGRTGRIPGGLAANLARCPTYFCCCCWLPNVLKQTCQPVRILRSGHAFWPQSTQVRFDTINYANTWWRLCARTVAYLNQATAMKEDFDQSERWVHSPSSKWDDWQMSRPIIKNRQQNNIPLGLVPFYSRRLIS